jgi:hypothetical protein
MSMKLTFYSYVAFPVTVPNMDQNYLKSSAQEQKVMI